MLLARCFELLVIRVMICDVIFGFMLVRCFEVMSAMILETFVVFTVVVVSEVVGSTKIPMNFMVKLYESIIVYMSVYAFNVFCC